MRELEIKLLPAWQRWQWLGVILGGLVALVVAAGLIAVVLRLATIGSLDADSPWMILQILYFVGFTLQMTSRARYLKGQRLRISNDGISWRLINGSAILLNSRPPISEEQFTWTDLQSAQKEASGYRFFLKNEKEAFIPLSFFTYAQRQDINSCVSIHVQEHLLELSSAEEGEGTDASKQNSRKTEPQEKIPS